MDLLTQINSDLIQAQKDKNEFVRDTLRYLKSSIKNAAINKMIDPAELSEPDILNVIQKEVKQRKDSASQFITANRPELAQKELDEATLFEKFLPAQLSDDELKAIINDAIKSTGAQDKKDIGKIMSFVIPKTQGKADGARISKLAMELLNHE